MGVAPMHVYVNGRSTNARVREWLQDMATSLSTLNSVAKKNSKSVVWQYFGLEADEKNIPKQEVEDQPVCRKCCMSEAWQHFKNVNNIEIPS